MPDLWVDVDAAVIVPVNVMPLLDDTDFKTIETAVVFNSAGLAVTWNFQTAAGVVTGTAVTPTSGGVYDWSEPVADKGMYAIEIPASGGASINNDTEGVGWFTGVATGVLPWRGPTIGFRRAALNDLFIDGGTASTNFEDMFDGTGYAGGTAKLTVDVVKLLGTAWLTPGTAGTPDVNTKLWNGIATVALPATPTNITAGTITTTTNVTNDVGITQAGADKVFGASGAALAELAQAAPSATPSPRAAMMLLYMALRNLVQVTATEKRITNDAGTVIAKKTLSDDGTTYAETEMATGP